NPLETKLGQFDRRDFLAAYLGGKFGDRHPLEISFGHSLYLLRETIGNGITPSRPSMKSCWYSTLASSACWAMRWISSSFSPNRYCSLICLTASFMMLRS